MTKRQFQTATIAAAFLVIAAAVCLNAQSPGKEIKGREIEWSDFKGEVDPRSPWDAYTGWFISFRYDRPDLRNGHAYIRAVVQLFMTPNSWVRAERKNDELLEHERGHYKIGRICMREIEKALNSTPFSGTDYQSEVDELYNSIAKRCHDFEEEYDRDTRHYHNREQQALWNKKLDDLLKP